MLQFWIPFVIYLAVAGWLVFQRYVTHARERFDDMLAPGDGVAIIMIALWPLTAMVYLIFILAACYDRRRGNKE